MFHTQEAYKGSEQKKKLCSCTGSFFDLVFMILKRRESLTAARKEKIFIYDLNMSQCTFFASSWISKRSLKVHKYFFLCSFALKSSPPPTLLFKRKFLQEHGMMMTMMTMGGVRRRNMAEKEWKNTLKI